MLLSISRLVLLVAAVFSLSLEQPAVVTIGTLQGGAQFASFKSSGGWGLEVRNAGSASVRQPAAVQLEFYSAAEDIRQKSSGYAELTASAGKATGTAEVAGPNGSLFTIEDDWSTERDFIELSRTVKIAGASSDGFLSSITFPHPEEHARSDVDYFAPGMIYGSPAHLSANAIGGSASYGGTGSGQVRIREDRLPAPMVGIRFMEGSALTVLDPAPKGYTTRADSHDTEVHTMLDERFQFGAIGADLDAGHHSQGFWFPGAEGEVTYRGNTYPGGQLHEWRRRYHPIRDGLIQRYQVRFRFTKAESFPNYLKEAWRWAYSTLKPPVDFEDILQVRRSIVDVLASQVELHGDRAGIPNSIPAVPVSDRKPDVKAIMGFTGKNLESAEYLLADAEIDSDKSRAQHDRKLGLAIFASFYKTPHESARWRRIQHRNR